MSTIEQIRQTAESLRAELASPDAPPPTLEEARALAEAAIGLVEENARLRVVVERTRSFVAAAADACDREAERHTSSRSSAPMVRLINVMARLRQTLGGTAPTAERKPVAGWHKVFEAGWVLNAPENGDAWAYEDGTWHSAYDRRLRSGHTASLEAAQLAAEDALFAIADAINALRPGAVESEVVSLRALVAELQKTNEAVSADRDQCVARVAEMEARLTANAEDAAGNERLLLGTMADLHGLEGRLLRSVGAVPIPDSDRWRWPGEEQALNGGAAVERALSKLRAAFDGAAKETDRVAALMTSLERIRQWYYRLRKLKVRVVDEKALAQVTPSSVKAYLATNTHWKEVTPTNGFRVWQHADGGCCAIPQEQTFADYGRRMLECLEAIAQAEEERSQLGVLVSLWIHENK